MSHFLKRLGFKQKGKDGLSFTPEEFATAVRKGKERKVAKMIDELISTGYCVLDWIQANAANSDLGYGIAYDGVAHISMMSQVPAIEDNEPDRHWFGMSFSREFFMNTAGAAGEELMQYAPYEEHVLDPVPGSRDNSQNMRQLAILLDEFTNRGIEVAKYLDEIAMLEEVRWSPLLIAMFDFDNGGILLRDAIRKDRLAQLIFLLLRVCGESPAPEVEALGEHILRVPTLRHHTALLLQQVTTGFHAAVSSFVDSLPAVEISTIPQDELRCPYCWGSFDEAPDLEEETDNMPVVAPCGSACPHRFGRSCLVEILKSSVKPLCPLCRQALEFPNSVYDIDENMVNVYAEHA
jgi:hypothetical protein